MKEAQIQSQILSWLNLQPKTYAWRSDTVGIPMNGGLRKAPIRGVSDIICIRQGRSITIEVKRPGGKISVHQRKFMENVYEAEGYPVVAYSLEDIKSIFKDLS